MIELIALTIVALDILLLLRNRDNPYLIIINFFLLYFNYSICFGVYILDLEIIDTHLKFYKQGELYNIGLILLFSFTLIRTYIFYPKIKTPKYFKGNSIFLYTTTLLILTYIAVFEIDRTISSSYEVKISPLYEYSFIFVLLAFYYLPKNKIFHFLLYLIVFILIIQDFYFGGRVTSLQILIVFGLMKFIRFITLRNIIIPFLFFNFIFSIVGIYRAEYKVNVEFGEIFSNLFKGLFISDTVIYAYFSSITHLFMYEKVDFSFTMESLLAFIILIFVGGIGTKMFGLDLSKAGLTDLASNYHWNVGGGVFLSYFYFWFGPYLFLPLIFIFLKYIKKRLSFTTMQRYFTLLIIVATIPRWYLYNPLALFRGVFFMLPLILFLYKILIKISNEKSTV